MQEREVVKRTRIFLQDHGLFGKRVLDLYTDAHPSLLIDQQLAPFQRFTLQFDAFTTHPDLVGRLDDGGTTFAIEAKGTDDWLKGIAQADSYRQGFNASIIAVAGTPSGDIVAFARQRGLGVLAVRPEQTAMLEQPPLHLPRLDRGTSILKQFSASNTLLRQFYYNLPTHYLACAACLRLWEERLGTTEAPVFALEAFVRILYPSMPQQFKPALRGAEQLGLIHLRGHTAALTNLGLTCAGLLPSPDQLDRLHQQALKQPLATLSPQTGAVLRILLEHEPIAAFITATLTRIGRHHPVTMPILVENASRLDAALTPVVFFFPSALPTILNDQGYLTWHKIQAQHYRTTVYMQYKRIMTHAGVIRDHGLAGTSSKHYQPEQDLWELVT